MKRPAHNRIDRMGQRSGMLTVVRSAGSKGNNAAWLVRCDCGVEKIISSAALRHKQKSCGCDQGGRRRPKPNRKYKLEVGAAARNNVYKQYRLSARSRGLMWSLSKGSFFKLTEQICHYCGAPPSTTSSTPRGTYTYNGVDRKNNMLGYLLWNVVPCCSICNHAKKDMPYEKFLLWLARVVQYRS